MCHLKLKMSNGSVLRTSEDNNNNNKEHCLVPQRKESHKQYKSKMFLFCFVFFSEKERGKKEKRKKKDCKLKEGFVDIAIVFFFLSYFRYKKDLIKVLQKI